MSETSRVRDGGSCRKLYLALAGEKEGTNLGPKNLRLHDPVLGVTHVQDFLIGESVSGD